MSCPTLEEVWPGGCPALEECRQLVADDGVCAKYDRPCGNAVWCLDWGYECDNRYDDRD